MATNDDAVQRWTDLKVRRWQGQHESSLIDGIRRKVTGNFPTEADVSGAERAKVAAESVLQQALIWRTKEGQEIAADRWWRRREAERGAPAKCR